MNFDSSRDERALAARPEQATGAVADVAPDDMERPVVEPQPPTQGRDDDALAPLFLPEAGRDFRARWDAIQIGFVDDPKEAVHRADELVREVLEELAKTFSAEGPALEEGAGDSGHASTERLRMALRRDRSFLERLLSL